MCVYVFVNAYVHKCVRTAPVAQHLASPNHVEAEGRWIAVLGRGEVPAVPHLCHAYFQYV